jgi:hypothetical protein
MDDSQPTFEELVTKRFELLEARIETGEQHMAELTMAYMEINATVEALLNHLFTSKDSPEAAAYQEQVAKIKAAMFNWMEHAGQQMATGGDSLNDTVLKLVRDGAAPDSAAASDPDPGDGEAGDTCE